MAADIAERDARVYFAAERTALAWVRTGITLRGFGFVVARFGLFLHELASARAGLEAARGSGLSLWAGASLMLFGVWINLAAALRHFRFRARFERGEPFVTPRALTMTVLSVLLAALGVGLTVYLVLLGLR